MELNYLNLMEKSKMKTEKELKELKEQLEKVNAKLYELSDEELIQVTGGGRPLPLPIIPED